VNLYVDDIRPCPYTGWAVARTVAEAIAHLELGDVVECSLDHDMGACDDCIKGNGPNGASAAAILQCMHVPTGTDLVTWMIATGNWPKHKPVVHSANPVGAKRMRVMIDANFKKAR
jgi:hypothetical protein